MKVDNIKEYMQRGKYLLDKNKIKEALALFEKGLKEIEELELEDAPEENLPEQGFINDAKKALNISCGRCLFELNRVEEALKFYKKAEEKQDTAADVNLYIAIATCFKALDKKYEEVDYLQKAVKYSPNKDHTLNLQIAEILTELKHHETALKHYEEELKKPDCSVEAYVGMAKCLASFEQYDKALKAYRQAEVLGANDVEFYEGFGVCLFKSGHVEEALDKLNLAEKIDEKRLLVCVTKGHCYQELAEPGVAETYFNRAQALGMDEKERIKQIGICNEMQSDHKEALEYLLKAYYQGVRDMEIHKFLGYAYIGVGDNDKGVAALETAEEMGMDDSFDYARAAEFLRIAKSYKMAWKYWQKAEKRGEDSEWFYERGALLCNQLLDFENGLKCCEKLVTFPDYDRGFLTYKGHCLMKLNRFEEAIEVFKEVEKLGFDQARIYSFLGDCEFQQKHYGKAYKIYGKGELISDEPEYIKHQKFRCIALLALERRIMELYLEDDGSKGEIYKLMESAKEAEDAEDYKAALEFYKKAEAMGVNDTYIFMQMAYTYFYIDDHENALEYAFRSRAAGTPESIVSDIIEKCHHARQEKLYHNDLPIKDKPKKPKTKFDFFKTLAKVTLAIVVILFLYILLFE